MNLSVDGLKESVALWKKAADLIPAGTQTLSKAPNQFVEGVYPKFIERGKGSHVWDVDGNEYIDYPLSLGAVLLGHCYPVVDKAITDQLKKGIVFSLMHRLEGEVAERVRALVPCAEQVRFSKTGSEVTTAAVRVARAATGRKKIAYCGYHGWHDWYAVTTTRSKGILPELSEYMLPFTYNDITTLERIFQENPDEIAAIIMEPVGLEAPKGDFLNSVQKLTKQHGSLLIFDEMITGFRMARGGAQEYYGITADLATFGKSVANGMPLSILAGRKQFMKECEEIFFSTTFGGEALSLAAARAVLDEIVEKPVVAHLWTQGRKLKDGFAQLAAETGVQAAFSGFPVRQFQVFRDAEGEISTIHKALFWQETIKRGVLFGNAQMISYSHSDEDIKRTLEVCGEALHVVGCAEREGRLETAMEGKLPTEIFRKP